MNEGCMVMDQKQLEMETEDIHKSGVRADCAQTMLAAVDSFDNGLAQGMLYTFYFQNSSAFSSLDQLVFAMDEALEKSNLPQIGDKLRREILPTCSGDLWEGNKASGSDGKQQRVFARTQARPTAKCGQLANFYIRVLCREHASMQGVLVWHETGAQTTFRSELELLLLLRSALNRRK